MTTSTGLILLFVVAMFMLTETTTPTEHILLFTVAMLRLTATTLMELIWLFTITFSILTVSSLTTRAYSAIQ